MKRLYICVDFDGTCVTHRYPEIGDPIAGAVEVLRELSKYHNLILYTMRSGPELFAAMRWFGEHKLPLFCANDNPTQRNWTKSPKIYGHLYIDDAAVGVPLVYPWHDKQARGPAPRPYVDWSKLVPELVSRGALPEGYTLPEEGNLPYRYSEEELNEIDNLLA